MDATVWKIVSDLAAVNEMRIWSCSRHDHHSEARQEHAIARRLFYGTMSYRYRGERSSSGAIHEGWECDAYTTFSFVKL